MSHPNPVLLGILNAETPIDSPVFAHVLHLAKTLNSDVHLFLSVYEAGFEKQLTEQKETEKRTEARAVVSARAQLKLCAEFLKSDEINTTTTLNWNKTDEAALQTVISKVEPDWLITQRPVSSWRSKLPLPDPTWDMSKLTKAPIIFVNDHPKREKPGAVWAAVDLASSKSGIEVMNRQIITKAKLLATYTHVPTHLVHCYSSGAELAEIAIGLSSTDYLSAHDVQDSNRMRHYEQLCELADSHGISHKNIHNLPGVAQVVLPIMAARHCPSYIVVGAHNPGRFAQFFHGSTTKKLLHRTKGALCVVRAVDKEQEIQ